MAINLLFIYCCHGEESLLYYIGEDKEKKCKKNNSDITSTINEIKTANTKYVDVNIIICGSVIINSPILIENTKFKITITGFDEDSEIIGMNEIKSFYVGSSEKENIYKIEFYDKLPIYNSYGYEEDHSKEEHVFYSKDRRLEIKKSDPVRIVAKNDDYYTYSDGKNHDEIKVYGYFLHDWGSKRLSGKIDSDGKISFKSKVKIRDNIFYVLENYQNNKSQGDWFKLKDKFYFDKNISDKNIYFPAIKNIIRIVKSYNVEIKNLTIKGSLGDAIQIFDSHKIHIHNNIFRYINGRGLVASNTSKTKINNNKFFDIGEGGIFMSGGDKKNLIASDNIIEENKFLDFNYKNYTYRPAVYIDGVGIIVNKNVIDMSNHAGIIFYGNDHIISNNVLSHLAYGSSDAGAIYTGMDHTARGTTITKNIIYNIVPSDKSKEVKGIYLDDQSSGNSVTGNIFYNVQKPVFIGGGRDNFIKNNYFCRSLPLVSMDARGVSWQKENTFRGDLYKKLIKSNYMGDAYKKYNNLHNIINDDYGMPKYNNFIGNFYVGKNEVDIKQGAVSGIELSENIKISPDVFNAYLNELKLSFAADIILPIYCDP